MVTDCRAKPGKVSVMRAIRDQDGVLVLIVTIEVDVGEKSARFVIQGCLSKIHVHNVINVIS